MSPSAAKKGAKARKDLQNDEAAIRSEAMLAYQAEFERIAQLFGDEMVVVKERLIARLERNLNETRQRCNDVVAESKNQVRKLLSGIVAFHRELSGAANLKSVVDLNNILDENRPLEIVAHELKQLAQEVTQLIQRGADKVSQAEKRIYHLENALGSKAAESASVERLLQDTLVRGTSETATSIEKVRLIGVELRERMSQLEERMKASLDDLIAESAVACYDANAYPDHMNIVSRDTVMSRFLSKAEQAKIDQAALLRDVRRKIIEMTKQKLQLPEEIGGKNVLSNIPQVYRHILASPQHFTRDDLLHVLNFVSFEPRVAEAIAAVLDEYSELLEQDHGATASVLAAITKVCAEPLWKRGESATRHNALVEPIRANLLLTPSKQHDPPVEPLLLASPAAQEIRRASADQRRRRNEEASYAMFRSREPGFRFPASSPSSPADSPRVVTMREAAASSVLFSQKQRALLEQLRD